MPTLIDNSNYNIYFKSCLLEEISVVGTSDFQFGLNMAVCPSPTVLGEFDFNLTPCPTQISPINFDLIECLVIGRITSIAYNGQDLSASFSSNIQLNSNSYNGQTSYNNLAISTTFDFNNYHGQASTLDLLTYPTIYFTPLFETGQSSDIDIALQHYIVPDINYMGTVLHDFNLTVAEFDSIEVEAQNGQSVITDLTNTPLFDVIFYHGQSSDADLLNLNISLIEVDFYHGQSSDSFVVNPDLFEVMNYTGQSLDVDLVADVVLNYDADSYNGQTLSFDLARTLAIYPRSKTGQSSELFDLIYTPAINIDVDYSMGSCMTVDTLTEDEWHFKNYTGQESIIDSMAVTLAMEFVSTTGASSVLGNLSFEAILETEINSNGQSVIIDELFVDLGLNLEVDMYNGQEFIAEDDIKIYQIFNTMTVQAGQAMYDGLGGAGGINFCTSTQDHSREYDFNVTQYDGNVWDFCGSKTFIKMDIELATNPRFKFNAYTGQNVSAFIPQRFLGFGIDDEDPRLYFTPILYLTPSDEMEFEAGNGSNMVYVNADGEDFLSFNAQSCTTDLTVSSWVTHHTGQSFEVNVNFDEADWKRGFKQGGVGQSSTFDFEPEICIRFCEGYLKPTGDSAIFDFANVDFLDCFGYFSYTGQFSEVSLSSENGIQVDMYNGQYFRHVAKQDGNLVPRSMYNGQISRVANGRRFTAIANNGQMSSVDFERRAYNAGNGQGSVLRDLAEAVPSLRFITDSGCLENQYIPLTADGDLDLTYEQIGATVEFEPFWTRIEGECVDEFTYKIQFIGEVINNGNYSSCTLTTESTIEIDMDNGANIIFEFE